MKLVVRFMRAFPLAFALAALLGLFAGVANAALIATIAQGLKGGDTDRLVVAFALAACISVLANVLSHRQLLQLANRFTSELRIRLARALLSAPYEKLEKVGGPRLLAALTDDAQTVADAASALVSMLIASTTVLGALGYIAWLSPTMCAVVLVPLALAGCAHWYFRRAGFRTFMKAMGFRGPMARSVAAASAGLKELKLHRERRAAFVRDGFDPSTRVFHNKLHEVTRLWAVGDVFFLVISFMAMGIAIVVWPRLAPMGLAALPGAVLALLYLPTSMDAVVGEFATVNQAAGTADALDALGLSLGALSPGEVGTPPPVVANRFTAWNQIQLRDVTYKYRSEDDREFTLGPLNLDLRPREIVFVTGGNGSGKTTLAKILVGLYVPQAGELRVDGHPVAADDLEQYRSLFAAIFSEYFLFDRVYQIEGELGEGASAKGHLERMALTAKVQELNGTFSTTDLSAGERKRLALVVALLQERPILLLDEWAAQQDPEFKELFYRQILPELRKTGKTVIVVTHDDRYFSVADRIVHLDEGKMKLTESTAMSQRETGGLSTPESRIV